MEEITDKEMQQEIEQTQKEMTKTINEGGKVIEIITYEKDKTTTEIKLEPVNGNPTSSKIVQTKDEITV